MDFSEKRKSLMTSSTIGFYIKKFSTIPQTQLTDTNSNKLECGKIVEFCGKQIPQKSAITYHSKWLDEDFVIDLEKFHIVFSSNVIYTEKELALIKLLSPEEIPTIHLAKKMFEAEIVQVKLPTAFDEFQKQVKELIRSNPNQSKQESKTHD